MSTKKTYSEKLRDPRWQKRRLYILERDDWTCQRCRATDKTLHVHHRWYEPGAEPWEAADGALQTLCEDCHGQEYQMRPKAEAMLLDVLRTHYSWTEVIDLADLILSLEEPGPGDELLDLIKGHPNRDDR
jgi:5-methylcytosine-specific restriction endonuclease McrA